MIGFIHLLIFIKTQILTDDHKEEEIQKDSHRLLKIQTNKKKERTNRFSIGGLIGVHVSSIVFEVIRTVSSKFFFYENILRAQKAQKHVTSENQPTKQKQANTLRG